MVEVRESNGELFDQWPEKYNSWFSTPIGRLVKRFESELLLEMLAPSKGERILDVGCGTGIFTSDVLSAGPHVVGLDVSKPMLQVAEKMAATSNFHAVVGDMLSLPFPDDYFDKVYSMTALEFVADGERAVSELERVARSGTRIVLTTLNSLSPWAERRKKKAQAGHSLFESMIFRSPEDLRKIAGPKAQVKTAIHFLKSDSPEKAIAIEAQGASVGAETGAFVAVSWKKG